MNNLTIQNQTFITDNGNVAKVVATIFDGDTVTGVCFCPKFNKSFTIVADAGQFWASIRPSDMPDPIIGRARRRIRNKRIRKPAPIKKQG